MPERQARSARESAAGYVATPMGVGGWPTWGPYGERYRGGIHLDCMQSCCRRWSPIVRELAAYYGPAFFSDGMGL